MPPLPPPATAASPAPHPMPLVWVHWATAGCIAVAFAAVLLREGIDDEAWRTLLLGLHRQAGLSALLLTLLRLLLRTLQRRAGAARGAGWQHAAAALVHAALYGVLLAVPLLGWALSDSRGLHPALWNVLPMPTLAAPDPDTADLLEDRHGIVAWTLGALATLHIAAALWHHWVLRDGVLRRMVPRRAAPPSPNRPQEPHAR